MNEKDAKSWETAMQNAFLNLATGSLYRHRFMGDTPQDEKKWERLNERLETMLRFADVSVHKLVSGIS